MVIRPTPDNQIEPGLYLFCDQFRSSIAPQLQLPPHEDMDVLVVSWGICKRMALVCEASDRGSMASANAYTENLNS